MNRTLAWSTDVAPPTGAGEGAGLATNPVGDNAVLFGGQLGGTLSGITQLFNESTDRWSTPSSPSGPSPRSYFAFAGASAQQEGVLFGGVVNATTLRVDNATWVYRFSTGTWTNVSSAVAPEPREDAAFAVDSVGGFGLLYGGWNQDYTPTSTVTYSDLWRLNLTADTWSQVSVAGTSAPPPLHGAALTWDSAAGRFDLFGGCYPCSSSIWQFDPTTSAWSLLPAPSGAVPAAREDSSWTWDPNASADVLFGGTNGVDRYNDTYEFLPATDTWVRETLPAAPTPRFGAASAWLNASGNQTLLLSGGNASRSPGPDLWRLAPTSNLSVLALNASSRLPIANASVSVDGAARLLTDAAGYVNLTQLVAEETSVNVTRLGYAANASSFWVAPASSMSVEYTLSTVAPAQVEVRVVNASGHPLANVTVSVSVMGVSAPGSPNATNSQGFVNFTEVPSEIPVPQAVINATAPKNYTNITTIAIPPGTHEVTELVLTAYPIIDLYVAGDLQNGFVEPVRDATVYEGGSRLGYTPATGWLNTTSVEAGKITLTVTGLGFHPFSEEIVVPETRNFTVRVTLHGYAFGTLEVWVAEATSLKPIVDAVVQVTDLFGASSVPASGTVLTNGTGWATFSLPEETYLINVTAYGYNPGSAGPVELLSNQTAEVTVYLELLPGADVNILVHAANTQSPIAGASVSFDLVVAGYTDTLGWANFTDLHFGLTELVVSHPGYYNNTTLITFAPEERIPELLVNLTPGIPVSSGGGGPPALFGGFPPGIVSLWPYLLGLAVIVVGAIAYLAYLRSPRGGNSRADTGSTRPSPAGTAQGPIPPPR